MSPLDVLTRAEAVPEPLLVTTHELAAWARHVRSPYAQRQDLASVTVPRLTDDQSDLRYERRGSRETTEFRFTSGVLRLELRQCIYLREDSPLAARAVWLDHERKHVQDNVVALEHLARELRRDPVLRAVFVERRWWQAGWPHMVRATVREGVAGIFWRLAAAAALRRDTQAAFARIERAIGRPPTRGTGDRGRGTGDGEEATLPDQSRVTGADGLPVVSGSALQRVSASGGEGESPTRACGSSQAVSRRS